MKNEPNFTTRDNELGLLGITLINNKIYLSYTIDFYDESIKDDNKKFF